MLVHPHHPGYQQEYIYCQKRNNCIDWESAFNICLHYTQTPTNSQKRYYKFCPRKLIHFHSSAVPIINHWSQTHWIRGSRSDSKALFGNHFVGIPAPTRTTIPSIFTTYVSSTCTTYTYLGGKFLSPSSCSSALRYTKGT